MLARTFESIRSLFRTRRERRSHRGRLLLRGRHAFVRGEFFEDLEQRRLLASFAGSSSGNLKIDLNLANERVVIGPLKDGNLGFSLSSGAWPTTGRPAGVWVESTSTDVLRVPTSGFAITITDSSSGNQVLFSSTAPTSLSNSFAITLDGGAAGTLPGVVTFDGTTVLTGSSSFSLTTSRNVVFNAGSRLSTTHGLLAIEANYGSTSSTFSGAGIEVNAATVSVTGAGELRLKGRAGSGVNPSRNGVVVSAGGQIVGGVGLSAARITGTGALQDADYNYGVAVSGISGGVASTITTNGADLYVDGTGGGTGASSSNRGVIVESGGLITAGGLGQVKVTGRGGNNAAGASGAWNQGVYVGGLGSMITSNAGSVEISGTGGGNSSSGHYNMGIFVVDSGVVTAGGTGSVTLSGTGGTSTGSRNDGIYVAGGTAPNQSRVTSGGGNVVISGIGGGTGVSATNYGVTVEFAGELTAGGSGYLQVSGIGGRQATGGYNHGVYVVNLGKIRSNNGVVQVTGSGGYSDTGLNNVGVYLTAGGQITAGGAGSAVDVTGTGGPSQNGSNHGIYIGGPSGSTASGVTSSGGNVTVTGTGRGIGSGGYNVGVVVDAGGLVTAGGTGTVTVKGWGAQQTTNSGSDNIGVYVNGSGSVITSTGGAVAVTGTGGWGSIARGVLINVGGTITSASTTAPVTVRGTGGSSSGNSNQGVYLTGGTAPNNSRITSGGGDVTVEGTGGGTGASSFNHGIVVAWGAQVSAGGAGLVKLTGVAGNTAAGGTGGSNLGLFVSGTSAEVTSSGGSVTVTGTGGNAGGSNYGVYIDQGGKIGAGGTGAVTVTGTGGTSSGSSNNGVYVTGGTAPNQSRITTSGGNLSVYGTGGGIDGSAANHGVSVNLGAQIRATGSGSLLIEAKGGNRSATLVSASSNYGLVVDGASSLVGSSDGGLQITATGGGGPNSSAGGQVGLIVSKGGRISGAGTDRYALITGQGGASTGDNNYGVQVTDSGSTITTAGGELYLYCLPTGSNALGLNLGAGAAVTTATSGGNVSLLTNSLNISSTATLAVSATGSLSLEPWDSGVNIDLGATGESTAGPLALSAAELARISGGTIVFGNLAGRINVSAPVTLTSGTALYFRTLNTDGVAATAAGAGITLSGRTMRVGYGTPLQVSINGSTAGTGYSTLALSGTVDLTWMGLSLSGSYVTSVGEVLTILTATRIDGTFNGLPNNSTVAFNGRRLLLQYNTTSVTLTDGEPQVLQHPNSQEVRAGESVSFEASAAGLPTPAVQWQVNTGTGWTNISGATATRYTFVAAASQNGAQYRAVFSNAIGTATTEAATLTVNHLAVGTSPAARTVNAGETVSFTATATASPAPSVQWEVETALGWSPIPDATSTTYSFVTAARDNGTRYRAVFRNLAGQVTSDSALLTVNHLSITAGPTNQTRNAGASVTFTAVAAANPAPSVQWQVNTGSGWSNIAGATSASYSFTTAASDNGTQYRAVFSNTAGTVTTSAATLTVNSLAITTQPASVTVVAGSTAIFTAAATGSPAPTLQWQVNTGTGWTNLAGATTGNFSVTPAPADNGTQYRAVFSNAAGTVTTSVATLTVHWLALTSGPAGLTLKAGETATFTASATGNPTPTVQWQVDTGTGWTDLAGATSTSYRFTATAANEAAQYRAVFRNTAGVETTATALLTVQYLAIVAAPASQAVEAGQTVTFTAAALGNPSPTVQWQLNTGTGWSDISGETGTTFRITAGVNDNGNRYRALFSNAFGPVATTAATLTVNHLAVVTQPAGQTVEPGTEAVFRATASGNPAPTVQWQVDTGGGWADILDATETTLRFSTTEADDGAQYRAVFSNGIATVISDTAVLRVQEAVILTVLAGGLQFVAANGFEVEGDIARVAGAVQIGFAPSGGEAFVPLLALDGDVTLDRGDLTLTASGGVEAVLGEGLTLPLIDVALGPISLGSLIGSGLAGLAGRAIRVAGVDFMLDALALAHAGSTPRVELQGSVNLAGLNVAVRGDDRVIVDASGVRLTGIAAQVPAGVLQVGALEFSTSVLTATYAAATSTFTLAGSAQAALPGVGNAVVTLGGGSTRGLVITEGRVSQCDATVSLDASLAGGRLQTSAGLLQYQAPTDEAGSRFVLTGTAAWSFDDGSQSLSLEFGTAETPGLVFEDGELLSFQAVARATDWELAGAHFDILGAIWVDQVDNILALSGAGSVEFADGRTLALGLGDADQPGVELAWGQLRRLDATATMTAWALAGGVFDASGRLSYDAEDDSLALSGAGSAVFGSRILTLDLGTEKAPGLRFVEGALASLSAGAVASGWALAGGTFNARATAVYDAEEDRLELSGAATQAFAGGRVLALTLGTQSAPGLVLEDGQLAALNATATASGWDLAGGVFSATGSVRYDGEKDTLRLSGSGTAAFGSGRTLVLGLGDVQTPGVLFRDGALASLAATATTTASGWSLAGGTFTATLAAAYDAEEDRLEFSGDAAQAFGDGRTLALVLGTASEPGLVLEEGQLARFDAVATASDWTLAGGVFNASGLLTYNGDTDQFAMSGTGSAVFGQRVLVLDLGDTETPGMQFVDGRLVSLDATATASGWALAGGRFDATVSASYDALEDRLELSGVATHTFGAGRTLALVLGTASEPGLVLEEGELARLDAAATATNWTLAGGTFNASGRVLYVAASDRLSLFGNGAATFGTGRALTLQLGSRTSPGLEFRDGQLASLRASATASDWTLAGGSFNATTTAVYDAAADRLALSGTGTQVFSGGRTLALTLGTATAPGLVLKGGRLETLNAAASARNWTLAGGSFNATGQATYDGQVDRFTLSGTGSAAFGTQSLTLTLGSGRDPGLVLSGGRLTQINATASATNWSLSGTTFNAPALTVTYAAASGTTPETVTLTGAASLTQAELGNIGVQLGSPATATTPATRGLVLRDGRLTDLDMTVTTSISVRGLSFGTSGLRMIYASLPGRFTLSGNANVAFRGQTLAVGLGMPASGSLPATNGLVVTNGRLTALDMTVNSAIGVSGLSFRADSLRLTADLTGTSEFTISGRTSFSVGRIGSIEAQLGTPASGSRPATRGFVIRDGQLTALDMTIDTNIGVAGVNFSTRGLRFTYETESSEFTLTGRTDVTVAGMAGLSATFGTASQPGLVVRDGELRRLDLLVNSTFAVGGLSFDVSQARLTYAADTARFGMTGSAAIRVGGLAGLKATFGGTSNGVQRPGLVIVDGQLETLDLTVSAGFRVGAVGFQAGDLRFAYQNLSQLPVGYTLQDGVYTGDYSRNLTYDGSKFQFTMSGTTSIEVGGLAGLNVRFGYTTTTNNVTTTSPGLTIVNGNLASLDLTVTTGFQVGAVSFGLDKLRFSYQNLSQLPAGTQYSGMGAFTGTYDTSRPYSDAQYQFAMSGTAFVKVGGMTDLSITLGRTTTINGVTTVVPGLAIVNGNLASLVATVDAGFRVGGVRFEIDKLSFVYQNLSQIPVGSGYDSNSVYTGAYDSSRVYNPSVSLFTLSGSASVAIGGMSSVAVAFGRTTTINGVRTTTPGLTVLNGNLASLCVVVSAEFRVGGVKFGARELEFTYQNLSQIASQTPYRGIGVHTGAYDLSQQYRTDNSQFMMSGTAFVTVGGMSQLSVSLGSADRPGLTIFQGNLQALCLTIDSSFKVGLVQFGTRGLTFSYQNLSQLANPSALRNGVYLGPYTDQQPYKESDSEFTMSGAAFVTVGGISGLSVTLGSGDTPGLRLYQGNLQSLSLTVDADFRIGAVAFGTRSLNFTYQNFSQIPTGTQSTGLIYSGNFTASQSYDAGNFEFTMSGTAYVSIGGMSRLSVTLGGGGAPGLRIFQGNLESLSLTVDADFRVGLVNFGTRSLNFTYQNLSQIPTDVTYDGPGVYTGSFDASRTYDPGTYRFMMSGTVYVSLAGISNLDVSFGIGTRPGLVIENGSLKSLDLTITSNISLAGLTLARSSLELTYRANTDTFTILGTASVDFGIGRLNVSANGVNGQGIVIQNGVLKTMHLSVDSDFGVGGLTIARAGLYLSYDATSDTVVTLTGIGSVSLGPLGSLEVRLAGDGTPGLVIRNGHVESFSFSITASLGLFGVTFGQAQLKASYANDVYIVSGRASIGLGGDIPSWVKTFMPTGSLASINCMFRIDTNHLSGNQSYAQFWTDIAGSQVGISIGFGGEFKILMGNALDGAFQAIAHFAENAYQQTAAAMVNAYVTAANGIKGVYNLVLEDVQRSVRAIEDRARAIADAIRREVERLAREAERVVDSIGSWFRSWNFFVSGATVFYDPLGNGVYIEGNPRATSSAVGTFFISLPANPTGQLVGYGGVITATALPNQAVLTAPVESEVISTLTTVLNEIMRRTGASEAEALDALADGLSLAAGYDVTAFGTMLNAYQGNADAARAFTAEVKVYLVAHSIAAVLSGVDTTNRSYADLMTAAFRELADALAAAPEDTPLDLADPAVVANLLNATAQSVDVTLDATLSGQVAGLIARIQRGVDSWVSGSAIGYLSGVAGYLKVATDSLDDELIAAVAASIAGDSTALAELDARETELALQTEASSIVLGNLIPPVLSIDSVQGVALAQGGSELVFTVSVQGPSSPLLPISVDYATDDLTASWADGDYTPVSGRLTWLPGETTSKQIRVPIGIGATLDPYKLLSVRLSQASNAYILDSLGFGTVDYSRFESTTALSTSTTSVQARQPVTLTASTSIVDRPAMAGAGTVTFYAGTTALGTAQVDPSGIATLVTTALPIGTSAVTAVYNGFNLPGEQRSASTSAALSVTVTRADQSIAFDPIADRRYGDGDFLLSATASSGELVTYRVVSGPATLDGPRVIPLGIGTVVIEAQQAGTDRFAPVVVTQSFAIEPAVLTVTIADGEIVYGDELPALSYRITGYVDDESEADLAGLPMLSVAAGAGQAGTYAIEASGGSSPNYRFVYQAGTLTIRPAILLVTVNDQSMTYGGTRSELSYSLTGFVKGETVADLDALPTLETVTATSGAGSYGIFASGGTDPNYQFAYVTGNLTIAPAPLVIAVPATTAVYGAVPVQFPLSYSGLVNGDTPESLGLTPLVTADRFLRDVGQYTLSVAGAVTANYAITYTAGTLTVTPAPLTIVANDVTIAFGEPVPSFTARYEGLVEGDTAESLDQLPTLSSGTTGGIGSFAIEASGALGANYAIQYVTGTLTITPRACSLQLNAGATITVPGRSVSLTALVTDSMGNPLTSGRVQFQVDGIDLGEPVSVDEAGRATTTLTALTVGEHAITATYLPADGTMASSSQSIAHTVVAPGSTSTTVQVVGNQVYGDTVSFLAFVQHLDPEDPSLPTGTIQFAIDGVPLGEAVELDANGLAISAPVQGIPGGLHSLSVVYRTQGSPTEARTSSLEFTIERAPQTLAFELPAAVLLGTGPITLGGIANTGLPVQYEIVSGPAVAQAGVLTIQGPGPIVIRAFQAGDANYLETEVVQSLQVNAVPQVSTSPSSQTVVAGSSVSLSATATGTPEPTVQWQRSDDGGASWTDLPGATSLAYEFTAQAGDHGSLYRAVFTNSVGQAISAVATLTVHVAPAVTTQPVGATVVTGSTVVFTAAATGNPAPSVQWQVDSGAGWRNIAGATAMTYSVSTTAGDSGSRYRAVFTNAAGSITTTVATLTVHFAPSITTSPQTATGLVGSVVALTAAATGNPTPAVQWQVSTDGGSTWSDLTGATSTTLSLTAAIALDGSRYRAVFSNGIGSVSTSGATLTVRQTPALASQSLGGSYLPGTTVVLSATATGYPAPAVQWQLKTATGWTDLAGATATTYGVVVTASSPIREYRAVFTNSAGAITSSSATVQVARNITSQIVAVRSGLTLNRTTGLFNGTITLTNTSSIALASFAMMLSNLTSGVSLANASGSVTDGTQYLNTGPLAAGKSVTLKLSFRKPTATTAVNYSALFYTLP